MTNLFTRCFELRALEQTSVKNSLRLDTTKELKLGLRLQHTMAEHGRKFVKKECEK
jgi:hypothetical protein